MMFCTIGMAFVSYSPYHGSLYAAMTLPLVYWVFRSFRSIQLS